MKKSLLNLLGVAALSYSVQAYSAGVGGINVESGLGQPLKADIELLTANQAEKSSVVARLASPEAYRSRGLDYPYNNKFKFAVDNQANGNAVIRVTSSQPIRDPFVSLLVDVNWASGNLERELTFLLDPPGYQSESVTPSVAVQTVAPIITAAPVVKAAPRVVDVQPPAPAVDATVAEPEPAVEPVTDTPPEEEAVPVHVLKDAPAATTPTASTQLNDGDIKVRKGDSLAKLAQQNAAGGVTLERMMVALYRENAAQFEGKNMNRIKAGKILHLPDAQQLAAISDADAKKQIHAQATDWNAYRQQVAGAIPHAAASVGSNVSSGKVSTIVADKTPVVQDNAKEVLKLSKGTAPTEKVSSVGKGATSQEQKNAAQEERIAQAKAASDEAMRVSMLEKNIKIQERLVQLKTESAALLPKENVAAATSAVSVGQVVAVSAVTGVSAVAVVVGAASSSNVAAVGSASAIAAASAVLAASEVPVVAEAASAVVAVVKPLTPIVAEPSLSDQIFAEPTYLIGGLAAALGLGGLGFAALKRRKAASSSSVATPFGEDFGSRTGRMAVPEISSPENGDFTKTLITNAMPASGLDEDDPISEANLFLSFGRDAQAEEILKEALQSQPNNPAIHAKLLEIYAKAENKSAFESTAKTLRALGDNQAWQKAQQMGKELDPNNGLYSAVVEIADSATMQTMRMQAEPQPESFMDTMKRKMSFESTGSMNQVADAEKTMIFTANDIETAQKAVMDFDVTGTNPGIAAAASMDFDITASHAVKPIETIEPAADMIFDITSSNPSSAATQLSQPAELNGIGLNFDLPTTQTATATPKAAEFDLSNISFDMDSPTHEPSQNMADSSSEVATKLDLATAYQEMGDAVGAREILEEVLREGNAEQRSAAQALINQLS
jgi:pilus assembly protein FimV